MFRASGMDRPPWEGPLLHHVAGEPDHEVHAFEGVVGWEMEPVWLAELRCRMLEFHYGVMKSAIDGLRARIERDRDDFIRRLLADSRPMAPLGKRGGKGKASKLDRYLGPIRVW